MRHLHLLFTIVVVLGVIGLPACGGGGGASPAAPEVHGVEPASGGVGGGRAVTIRGAGLAEVVNVVFGVQAASDVVVVDDATLACTTPPGTLGPVPVTVESSGASATLENAYTYHPAPGITDVSPPVGPLAGGSQVTLTGIGFLHGDPGAPDVTIGGRPATGVVVASDTSITCTAPPGAAAATVGVAVRNRNGSDVLPASYLYAAPPTVTQVQANSGPAGGGTRVTVTGSGFDVGGLRVTFGGVESESTTLTSPTTVDCKTPGGPAGAVDVRVETWGGSDVLSSSYTYTTWAPNDTSYYPAQWHLYNDGSYSNTTSGEDANVVPAWTKGYTGAGIRIAILDDGLEIAHEDLSGNVVPGTSWDYANGDNDPTMGEHGTSVAGVAAAVGGNALGVTGAAPNAELSGFNVLAASYVSDFADAFSRNASDTGVSNSSWGVYAYSGGVFRGYTSSYSSWQTAINTGLSSGRNGRGIVYVKSAGNHYPYVAHFDGTNNLRGIMCIGAVNSYGQASYYSQPGCNVVVCAPSNGGGRGITTTDRTGSTGYSATNYTSSFGGTSSAAPLAAGCVALVLEANPDLRWWEVPVLLARTSRRVQTSDSDWTQNGAGHWVNHQFGYGVIDTGAAVTAARSWTPLPSLVSATQSTSVGQTVTANGSAVTSTITIPSTVAVKSLITATVSLTIDHPRASDLELILTSPDGTQSVFCPSQTYSSGSTNANSVNNLPLLSYRHIDEDPAGTWTMSVRERVGTSNCTWSSWAITLEGASSTTAVTSAEPASAAVKPAIPAAPLARSADEIVYYNGLRWERAARDASGEQHDGYPVFRDSGDEDGLVRALTGRIVVQLDPRLDTQAVEDWEVRHSLRRLRALSTGPNWFVYDAPGGPTASVELANTLLGEPEVFHAEPDWWTPRYQN